MEVEEAAGVEAEDSEVVVLEAAEAEDSEEEAPPVDGKYILDENPRLTTN